MTTWRDAPDASGLWWRDWGNRRLDVVEVTVDESDGDVWFRDEDGDYIHISKHRPARWCRVATPDRVEALESALRDVVDAYEMEDTDRPCARYAVAVLRGTTVAGERGSR